jgi:hypothetical protein
MQLFVIDNSIKEGCQLDGFVPWGSGPGFPSETFQVSGFVISAARLC